MRTRVVVAAVTLLLAGCSSERMRPGEDERRPLLAELPTDCEGLGGTPARGHVSFVADGRLFSVSANGDHARCVTEGIESAAVTWGARGDRFLLGDADDAEVFRASSNEAITKPGPGAALQGLSRPEGTQVVFVTDGGDKLVKVPSEGGPPNDISFLARHDEAVYHPAGTHVAVVGEDADGDYGIYLATNEGKDVRQLVAVTAAQEVYEPVFSHDGDTMFYVADHGGRWDLHSFSLSSTPNAATEEQLATVAGFRQRIDHVEVSPFAEYRVAYRVGDCESGYRTFVHTGSKKYEAAPIFTDAEPVGWLPNGDLIVAWSAEPCAPDPSFDLFRGRRNAHDLLVAGVTRPAIRAALPPPPRSTGGGSRSHRLIGRHRGPVGPHGKKSGTVASCSGVTVTTAAKGTSMRHHRAGANVLTGGQQSDLIEGRAGDDMVRGNLGNDRLDGGPGNDTIDGGEGDDECTNGEQVTSC